MRVLKPGGKVIVSVPHKEDLRQSMVLCPKCGSLFRRFGHMQVFDRESITRILEDEGLKVVDVRVLPLGFMATQLLLKHLKWLFEKFGFLRSQDIFVVAAKK